ncbi:MAG: NAD(P)-dependent oxidoreductase, partial [bacterium]|nr:NAD(P)-dependent oxidoreductase [bacterium]
ITGAKGFIGKELILQCEKQGIEIIEADLPEFDIRKKEIADLIPEGVDAIVHLAALSSDTLCRGRASDCFDVNVMATLNLMDAAEKKKAKQFIFASSEWVYDNCFDNETKTEDSFINIANHTSEYALSKLVSEANLRQKYQHGFCPVTILRFGIIYGPRKEGGSAVESLFRAVKEKDEIEVGSLKTGRHFIHVSDIASGIIKSIGLQGFNIVNLEGDKLITLGDIIETSKEILNKNPKIIETNPNNSSVRRVSSEKAKKLLNWKPEIDLEIGLETLLI